MLTAKEKELFLKIVEEIKDTLANKTCNDIDPRWLIDWTKEEQLQAMKEFHEWNGDPEEFNKDSERSLHYAGSDGLFAFFIHKLLK